MDAVSTNDTAPVVSRRSRMRRQSSGKRIFLTPRDLAVFSLLARYRYLRSTDLHAFVGGAYQSEEGSLPRACRGEKRFVERLGALYHDGRYINRPKAQWECADARCMPVIYELDERGREALREADASTTLSSRTVADHGAGTGADRHFRHSLMVCETLASIELATREEPAPGVGSRTRFVSWQEIQAKEGLRGGPIMSAGSTTVIPDGLFGIEYQGNDAARSYRFFALEVERRNRVDSTKPSQTSWRGKVLAYREIVARKGYTALGIPNLLVLAVAPSAAHIESMKKVVMDVTDGKGSALFLFRAVPEMTRPVPKLFTGMWERAGREEMTISPNH